jgi:hypothetical protein
LARRKRNVVSAIGPPRDLGLMIQLAAELQQVASHVQTKLGFDGALKERAAGLARQSRRIRQSDQVLDKINSMARVLEEWQRNRLYRGADGSPKVIPIRGQGTTFESLIRKFAPGMSIPAALRFLASQSDVRRVSDKKVALLGSVDLIYPGTPEVLLAAMVVRIRRLANTMMRNARIPPEVKGTGLFERQVKGRFTKKQWTGLKQALRSPLSDLVHHVDQLVEDCPKTKDAQHYCGMSVFLWED